MNVGTKPRGRMKWFDVFNVWNKWELIRDASAYEAFVVISVLVCHVSLLQAIGGTFSDFSWFTLLPFYELHQLQKQFSSKNLKTVNGNSQVNDCVGLALNC